MIPFSRFIVHGASMLPALKPGQSILVFNWAYTFSQPKVGDIVVIKHSGRDLVKRIQKVHDREYFVQGDNPEESTDSRSFGAIDKSQLIGKVIYTGL